MWGANASKNYDHNTLMAITRVTSRLPSIFYLETVVKTPLAGVANNSLRPSTRVKLHVQEATTHFHGIKEQIPVCPKCGCRSRLCFGVAAEVIYSYVFARNTERPG